MRLEDLPIEDIARLFDRDLADVQRAYQEWLLPRQRRNRPITPNIKLLALFSGLSTASISNFLRNKRGSLAQETRQRLTELVELVNYVPSGAARSLRGQRRNAVGVALPLCSVSPGFYLETLSGIKQEADILGFRMFVFAVTTLEQRNDFFGKMPFLDIVDGLIVVGLNVTETQLQILGRRALPVVAVHNRLPRPATVANILTLNEQSLQDLIDRHLIKYHGYRRLALVTLGTSNTLKMGDTGRGDWNRVARVEAYKEALKINGVALDERLIFEVADHSFEEGYKAFNRICLLNDSLPPDQRIQAIVCTSDTLAAAVLTAARRKGMEIPVTGFDNLALAGLLDITTVDQKAREVGRLAFRHLYSALIYQEREGTLPPLVEEGFDMQMVIRRSCGCSP